MQFDIQEEKLSTEGEYIIKELKELNGLLRNLLELSINTSKVVNETAKILDGVSNVLYDGSDKNIDLLSKDELIMELSNNIGSKVSASHCSNGKLNTMLKDLEGQFYDVQTEHPINGKLSSVSCTEKDIIFSIMNEDGEYMLVYNDDIQIIFLDTIEE